MLNVDAIVIATRDQLAAELREVGRALSTMQLAARCGLPWHRVRLVASCSQAQAFAGHRYGAVIECCGRGHVVAVPPLPGLIHPLLIDLEAAGIITRVMDPGISEQARESFVLQANHGWVQWRYLGPRSDSDFAVAELTGRR